MTRFGETSFGVTHLGGAMALPAVSLATMLFYNYDLWPSTMSAAWETVPSVREHAYDVLRKTLDTGSELIVGTARVAGKTVGAAIGGAGEALPEGFRTVMSQATLTIAVVVGSLLGLAVLRASKA